MKRFLPLFLFFALMQSALVYSQPYPPLELSGDVVTSGTGTAVDVSIRAGMNFQNITFLSGTIVFDTTVATYGSMTYWGLSNPNGVNFTYQGGGRLSFTWSSLITIGPTLSAGDRVFTLSFNVVGAPGTNTFILWDSIPTQHQWGNGFGWGGTNFAYGPGQINVICGQPTAAFTSTDSLLNWDFTFNGQSTSGSTYFWDFGDGNTSTLQNPSHTYASGGSRVVCVTVSDTCGTDSICQTVNVCPLPTPNYTQSSNNQTVTFTDQTTGLPSSWLWDFGDGNISTQQNPVHTYASTGTYTVCLTSTNACGSDSTCRSIQVTCITPVTAWTNSANELVASFNDISAASPTSWFWDFGDGNTSTMQNPMHTYNSPGTYQVCLTTTNVCGSDSSCSSVTVTCAAPTAAFTDSTNALVVDLFDLSTNGATGWLWDFGDGVTSTQQNPTHTYAAPGTYLVCLTATSLCGSDSSCVSVTVACDAPVAAFTESATARVVQFTDNSTNGATGWSWDFGDGNVSSSQSPSHTYTADGTYWVCLIARSICGADTVCDSVSVIGAGVAPEVVAGLSLYPNPAYDLVQIEVTGGVGITQVRMVDAMGKAVRTMKVNGQHKVQLTLSELPRGLYLIEVERGGQWLTRKVIVE